MESQVSHTHTVTVSHEFTEKLDDSFTHEYLPIKRVFDVLFSLILMIPASILIFIFAILVKLETPGKAFYSQERVGLMGQVFRVTKLRSMYSDAEKKSGAMWAKKSDSRVTKIGHFMRKTRIDELPQLWSVIKGDMSLIGPRPERPMFTQQFSEDVEGFEQRLLVKPGLSGYAQVHGGYDDTPAEKLANDMYYINHFGMFTDLMIFFETIRVVVTGDGAR